MFFKMTDDERETLVSALLCLEAEYTLDAQEYENTGDYNAANVSYSCGDNIRAIAGAFAAKRDDEAESLIDALSKDEREDFDRCARCAREEVPAFF